MTKTDESQKIDRRTFALYIILASGISFFGGYFFHSKKIEDAIEGLNNAVTDEELTDLFADIRESAQLIGEKYSRNHPESSKSDLMNELKTSLESQELNYNQFFSLTERIRHKIITDYKNSHFVEIENWILTKTEAQLCALLYL